jgi:hypothetical protein
VGDLGHDLDIGKKRLPDLDIVAVGQEQNFGKINGLANIAVQLFHPHHVAASHLILLAARSHYRIHAQILVIFRRKAAFPTLRIRVNLM